MRSLIKFFTLFILTLFLSFSVFAEEAGPGHGGGGSSEDAEFYKMARYFSAQITEMGDFFKNDIPSDKLSRIVQRMRVKSSPEKLTLRGASVEAINYPEALKVIFSELDWNKKTPKKKYQLVIHELLGLLEIPDVMNNKEYLYSELLAERTFPLDGVFYSPETVDCTELGHQWELANQRINVHCKTEEECDNAFKLREKIESKLKNQCGLRLDI